MPHAAPSFSRKHWSHDFHKPNQINTWLFQDENWKDNSERILFCREKEREYAAHGGKCGSPHQPGFSSVSLIFIAHKFRKIDSNNIKFTKYPTARLHVNFSIASSLSHLPCKSIIRFKTWLRNLQTILLDHLNISDALHERRIFKKSWRIQKDVILFEKTYFSASKCSTPRSSSHMNM